MLAWLKDIFRPIRRVDPLFGPMRCLRDSQLWEGWAPFAPVPADVEVLFSALPGGPSEEQRAFFKASEARYQALWPVVETELNEAAEAATSRPEGGRFILKGIDLPCKVGTEPKWELLYETEPQSWFFAVQMNGWAPADVSVEC
jgi:hypothetical protein